MGVAKAGRSSPQLEWNLGDWMDNCGVFGCDENCSASRNVLGMGLRLPLPDEQDLQNLDYASLHDEFLESLLFEQTRQHKKEPEEAPASPDAAERDASPRKRRRALRLNRRSTSPRLRSRSPRVAPALNSSSSTIGLEQLSKQYFPDPSTYMHPQCRMQKDKGKGEAVGANICAKGCDACLEKLREKMKILTDVVVDPNKGPATMKRKKARVSEAFTNFTETRSLIELRMGFLSMTYGVLLRWDTGRTGKITLVVLRKMCSESFYPARSLEREPQWVSQIPDQPQTHLRDIIDQRHAILQRADGMEVTLVDAPYRVSRPVHFEPAVLRASVEWATGLSKRSNWTVKLVYETHSENILLSYDESQGRFCPKLGEPLRHYLQQLSLSPLEVRLYEHRLRRQSYRRHITTMHIPLANLEPQPSASVIPVRLVVPCKHDEDASLALNLSFVSDYARWLNRELEARGREERRAWRSPFYRTYAVVDEEIDENPWDWICHIC